jgi:hypothetical protein
VVLGAVVWAAGCAAGSPFLRPALAEKGTITDEATGQVYDDCRAAFAAATTDTVLTFSAGLFRCGPEITASAQWLVVRGAGLGKTWLETGDPIDPKKPPPPLHLTAIRPGKLLRVEDLSFGGLTDLPYEDGHVILERVFIATERPALIGGPGASMAGNVVILHSVLTGWSGPRPTDLSQPKPLALQGNEKVALVEDVLYDVEQEFERYPAPGSVVLLSSGVEQAFAEHKPASASRPDRSNRHNVACGAAKNPQVVCASAGQPQPGDTPIQKSAALLWAGAQVALAEPLLHQAADGFAKRYTATLGKGVHQADVYWFDEEARTVEEESRATAKDAVAVLARARMAAVVENCGHSEQSVESITSAMAGARTIDHVLGGPTAEDACRKRLQRYIETLHSECQKRWNWEQILQKVATIDNALANGGTEGATCRQELAGRVPGDKDRGPLAEVYARELSKALGLPMTFTGAEPVPALTAIVKLLPWVVTRASRTPAQGSSVLDHLLHAAQVPGSGDGRQLVETTAPCAISNTAGGARAATTVTLGELPPNARTGTDPRTVTEVLVSATRGEIPSTTPDTDVNTILLSRCEERTGEAYDQALRKYFVGELDRLLDTSHGPIRSDLEVVAQLVHEEVKGPPLAEDALPHVPAAAERIGAVIRSLPLDVKQVGAGRLEDAPVVMRAAPQWKVQDVALAADQLAHASSATTDACQIAMPDISWQRNDKAVRGAVSLESTEFYVDCRPRETGFELALLISSSGKPPPQLVDMLMRGFVSHMGWPKNDGPATATKSWKNKKGRSVVLNTKGKPDGELAIIAIELGSTWSK